MKKESAWLKLEKVVGLGILLLGSLCFLAMLIEAWQPAIIGDETFSMNLIKCGYVDIIRLTAQDVHPPLYYLILKFVVGIGALLGVTAVTAGKIASIIPFFLLGIISFTEINRRFGKCAAGIFYLCVMGMPHMQKFAVEIRMYSWGMLFLVMAYLAFYDILYSGFKKEAWIKLVFFTVAASYTHYFACMAAGYLYLALLIYCAIWKRDMCKSWILYSMVTGICYLPWLPILIKQITAVKSNYWIENISLSSLKAYFQFIFNPAVYIYYSGTILGLFLFIIFGLIVFVILFKQNGNSKEKQKEINYCIFAGSLQTVFVIFVGILFSWFATPILVQRYLFFCMGVLWLSFSIAVSQMKKQIVVTGVCLFLMMVAFLNLKAFIRTEEESRAGWKEMDAILAEIGENDIILSNFGQVRLALSYYKPKIKVCYYWRQRTESLFLNLYGNLEDTRDEEAVFSHLTDKNTIYYFDTLGIGEFHLQDDFSEDGIVFEKMETCLIEDIWVQVYKIRRSSC